METNQIYTIVNEVVAQGLGRTDLAVVDTASLVSLGNTVLTSAINTEAFTNTLAQRIGKTIFAGRLYRNKLNDMVLEDFEYGAILQKISVGMPDAVADQTFELTDGESVDPWIVSKPKLRQKLFVKRTPYTYFITISRKLLKEAFVNESGMASLISFIFEGVRNKLELALENLARATQNNFACETSNVINLVTEFNADYPAADAVTSANCMQSEKFMRFAIARIKDTIEGFTDMSTMYNDGEIDRHTPYEDQRLRVLSKFQTRLETNVLYQAFHDDYVNLVGYKKLNFWQSKKEPMSISCQRASDNREVTINNVVAMLYDRDALGVYKEDEEVLTTPVNARARYYNTYWHCQRLWFNDLDENFVLFTLN